jgi:hypothetical protein
MIRLSISNSSSSVAPSVYIAYHNMEAYVSCSPEANVARGRSYSTTVSYAPEDLSTAMSTRPQQTQCTYISIDYTTFGDYS